MKRFGWHINFEYIFWRSIDVFTTSEWRRLLQGKHNRSLKCFILLFFNEKFFIFLQEKKRLLSNGKLDVLFLQYFVWNVKSVLSPNITFFSSFVYHCIKSFLYMRKKNYSFSCFICQISSSIEGCLINSSSLIEKYSRPDFPFGEENLEVLVDQSIPKGKS